jgi:hypothetical protein
MEWKETIAIAHGSGLVCTRLFVIVPWNLNVMDSRGDVMPAARQRMFDDLSSSKRLSGQPCLSALTNILLGFLPSMICLLQVIHDAKMAVAYINNVRRFSTDSKAQDRHCLSRLQLRGKLCLERVAEPRRASKGCLLPGRLTTGPGIVV